MKLIYARLSDLRLEIRVDDTNEGNGAFYEIYIPFRVGAAEIRCDDIRGGRRKKVHFISREDDPYEEFQGVMRFVLAQLAKGAVKLAPLPPPTYEKSPRRGVMLLKPEMLPDSEYED